MCRSIAQAQGNPNRRCPQHRPDSVIAIHTVSKEVSAPKEIVESVFTELHKEGKTLQAGNLNQDNYASVWGDLTERFNALNPTDRYTRVMSETRELTPADTATTYALRRLKGATASRIATLNTSIADIAERTNTDFARAQEAYNTLRGDTQTIANNENLWTTQAVRRAQNADLPSDKNSIVALALLQRTLTTPTTQPTVTHTPLTETTNGVFTSGGYNPDAQRLELSIGDTTYAYRDVPAEHWEGLTTSDAPLTYFVDNIHGNEEYQYENQEAADLESHFLRCASCGQFMAPNTNHDCPSPAVATVTVAEEAPVEQEVTPEPEPEPAETHSEAADATPEPEPEPEPEPDTPESAASIKEKISRAQKALLDSVDVERLTEGQRRMLKEIMDGKLYQEEPVTTANVIHGTINSRDEKLRDESYQYASFRNLTVRYDTWTYRLDGNSAQSQEREAPSGYVRLSHYRKSHYLPPISSEDREMVNNAPENSIVTIAHFVGDGVASGNRVIAITPPEEFKISFDGGRYNYNMFNSRLSVNPEEVEVDPQIKAEVEAIKNNPALCPIMKKQITVETRDRVVDARGSYEYNYSHKVRFRTTSLTALEKKLAAHGEAIVPVTFYPKEGEAFMGSNASGANLKYRLMPSVITGEAPVAYLRVARDENGRLSVDETYDNRVQCEQCRLAYKRRCVHEKILNKEAKKVFIEEMNKQYSTRSGATLVAGGELPSFISESGCYIIDRDTKTVTHVYSRGTRAARRYLGKVNPRNKKFHDIIEGNLGSEFNDFDRIEAKRFATRVMMYSSTAPQKDIRAILQSGHTYKMSVAERVGYSHNRQTIRGDVYLSLNEEGKPVANVEQLRCSCGRFVSTNKPCAHILAMKSVHEVSGAAAMGTFAQFVKPQASDQSFTYSFNLSEPDERQRLKDEAVAFHAMNTMKTVKPLTAMTEDEQKAYREDIQRVVESIKNGEDPYSNLQHRNLFEVESMGYLEGVKIESNADSEVRSIIQEWEHANPEAAINFSPFEIAKKVEAGLKYRKEDTKTRYAAEELEKWEQYEETQKQRWANPEEGLDANDTDTIKSILRARRTTTWKTGERQYENITQGICDPNVPGSRRFGLEIEFTGNVDLAAVSRELNEAGLTDQPNGISGYHGGARSGWSKWTLERDCTVTGELVSPPLSDSPEDWKQVEKALEILKRHGATADKRAGGHINISTGSNRGSLAPSVETAHTALAYQEFLYNLAANPDRRSHRGTRWCTPNVSNLPNNNTVDVAPLRPDERMGAHGEFINFANAKKNDSSARVEYRLWDGSLDFEAIQTQVAVSAAITDRSEHDVWENGHARRKSAKHISRDPDSAKNLGEFLGKFFTKRDDREKVLKLFAHNAK